jgi:hypothetical protein
METLTNKYAIGTHVMFYEIEMLPEHVTSIITASKQISNPENIIVDLFFNMSEFFEKIDTSKISKEELINKFKIELNRLADSGVSVRHTIYTADNPYTMTNFRRDFNYGYCNLVDYLIWGETDCLLPRETFISLEQIKNYANSQNIHRFITTFATRKMWDDSWKVLEHVDFENKQFYDRDNPLCYTEKYSIRYVMNQEEMDEINSKSVELDVRVLTQPKFDGSCLIISSDLIKMGVNIPPGFFGLSAEDTAFMYSCMQLLGKSYIQFVVKNILKVHNREHTKKRLYALNMNDTNESTQRVKGDWYNKLRDINKQNLNLFIGPRQDKFLTYEDFLKTL